MNIEEFFAANETIEFNPVKRVNARVKQICEQILPADLRPDVRVVIEGSRLAALHNRAKGAIERGRTDLIEPMLADFANDLRAALNFERTSGALKAMTADTEVKRIANAGLFQKFCWNGHHTHTLAERLEQDDLPIVSVDYDGITTSKRTIRRDDDFWDLLRPSGTSKEFWAKRGVPDLVVQRAKDMAQHVERERNRPFAETSGISTEFGGRVAPR